MGGGVKLIEINELNKSFSAENMSWELYKKYHFLNF